MFVMYLYLKLSKHVDMVTHVWEPQVSCFSTGVFLGLGSCMVHVCFVPTACGSRFFFRPTCFCAPSLWQKGRLLSEEFCF